MNDTLDRTPVAKWFTQGVVLAAVPFTAYALALTFALGRASRLGYPAMLVSPTRPMVLMYLTSIANLALVFGSLLTLASGAYSHRRLPIRLLGALPAAIGLWLFLFLLHVRGPALWIPVGLALLLAAYLAWTEPHQSTPVLGALRRRDPWAQHLGIVPVWLLVLLSALFLAMVLTYQHGRLQASHSKFYTTEYETQRVAILDSEGTRAIGRVLTGTDEGSIVVFDLTRTTKPMKLETIPRWWPDDDDTQTLSLTW